MSPLVDPFGRAITYIRVSVTDRCDFRCVYCMSEDMTFLPKQDLLSLEELDRLCSAFVRLGTRKIRVTGGEPLVRRGIMTLFRSLSRHIGEGASRRADRHHERLAARPLRRGAQGLRRRAHQCFGRHAQSREVPRPHPLGRLRPGDEGDRRGGRGGAQGQDQRRGAEGRQRRGGARDDRLGARARLRHHLHRGDAARRDRRGALRPISAADRTARRSCRGAIR